MTAVLVIAEFAGVLGAFLWIARRIRRRGIGGAAMGPIDEIYQPSALRTRQEIQVQAEARSGRHAAGSPGLSDHLK